MKDIEINFYKIENIIFSFFPANGSSINVFFFDAIAEELNACKTDVS